MRLTKTIRSSGISLRSTILAASLSFAPSFAPLSLSKRSFMSLALAFCSLASFSASAQTYPERPIRLIQGFAPGGNADTIARLLGAEVGKSLGQPFVVEAVSGAGGNIAAAAVARAKPDGYTLLLATGGHAVAGALYKELSYKTVDDFEMISTITFFPFLLVVKADSPYRQLSQLFSDARAKPQAISYGSAGIGSTHHLAGELLSKMSQTNLLHVPYRGDAASITGLLSGEIPMIIAPPTAVLGNIKAGKLRAIAVTGPQRWSEMPELATVAEQGVAGYDVRSWAGLMAPAGLPKPVQDRLTLEVGKALQLAQIRERLKDMGGEVRASTPEDMKALVSSEVQRWTRVVNDANIPKQ
jgi:tripartite-type tricarboxylate transporter receptor subunit TctC